ncbi:MAG: Na+/H+ antiporter [Acetobacteraceae bacterium]|nr:Na+/H+ antiporter [Acetobacteraceae bacterium]
MEIVQIVLGLVAVCILLAVLARWAGLPYAVVLIVAGMMLAFVPGLPRVALDPDLALAFFLPPLLQASAYRTDWRAFRRNLRPILLLAVGCVIFTAALIGAFAKWLVPEMPWAAAFALGAILAPPDAVAAAAVLQRLRLPRRIVTVLEGESLINDASALIIYRFAILAAAAGSFVPHEAALGFLMLGAGGLAVGFAVAWGTIWLLRRLDDTLLETALSFLAAYAAYLLGEALHVSGVIAVVTCGIMLGQAQHSALSARTRTEARTVWQFVDFLLTSLVFILIGLQLNDILSRLDGRGPLELAGLAIAVSLALVASRFIWVFPATYLARLVPAVRRADPAPPWQHVFVISWSGMRGVVSLAAAIALPTDFPQRDLIVFLAFCAILATLVVQGTTLEWIIRRLGLQEAPPAGGVDPHLAAARHVAAQAMLRAVERHAEDVLEGPVAADLVPEFRDRANHIAKVHAGGGAAAAERAARLAVRLGALRAGRAALVARHAEGHIPDEAMVTVMTELDHDEHRVRSALG